MAELYPFDGKRYPLPPSVLYYLSSLLLQERGRHSFQTLNLDWNASMSERDKEMLIGSTLAALLYLLEHGVLSWRPGVSRFLGLKRTLPKLFSAEELVRVPVAGLEARLAHTPCPKNGLSVGALLRLSFEEEEENLYTVVLRLHQSLLVAHGLLRPRPEPVLALGNLSGFLPIVDKVADYAEDVEDFAASMVALEFEHSEFCKEAKTEVAAALGDL